MTFKFDNFITSWTCTITLRNCSVTHSWIQRIFLQDLDTSWTLSAQNLDIVHFQGYCTTCTCELHKSGKLLGAAMSTSVLVIALFIMGWVISMEMEGLWLTFRVHRIQIVFWKETCYSIFLSIDHLTYCTSVYHRGMTYLQLFNNELGVMVYFIRVGVVLVRLLLFCLLPFCLL